MGRVDHLLLCRSSTRACFGLGLPGSRQAIHLLIVVFVRGLRKTIAPGSRAARGPWPLEECGVNSISNAPRSDRMPITCKSTIRGRSREEGDWLGITACWDLTTMERGLPTLIFGPKSFSCWWNWSNYKSVVWRGLGTLVQGHLGPRGVV